MAKVIRQLLLGVRDLLGGALYVLLVWSFATVIGWWAAVLFVLFGLGCVAYETRRRRRWRT